MDEKRQHVFVPWAVQNQQDPVMTVTHAEGVYFYDAEGKRYLDFSSQLYNVNLGHGNRRVVEAIQRQAEKLCYIGPSFATEPKIELGRRLAAVTPGDLTKAFLTNSGSETNEMAFMMARMYTGRPKIMAKYRSYHGTTVGTLSVGGDPRRFGAEPIVVPNTVRFFGPYCYRCPFDKTYPGCGLFCLERLEEQIVLEDPSSVAAIVIEPVTGSNGAMVVPDGYLEGLRTICDRYGILLIADEVIDGFCRTGEWFAVDHWNVVPDILSLAKGITSGYLPLGAAMVREKIAAYFEDHLLPLGCTYTGHPLACAAAVASLQEYEEQGVLENVRAQEKVMKEELGRLMEKHSCVGEIRGLGLLWCIELTKDRAAKTPIVGWNEASDLPGRIKRMFFERGVSGYTRWNWIFLSPPLIITEEQLRWGLDALDEVLGCVDEEIGRA